jgi:hypothetical protein
MSNTLIRLTTTNPDSIFDGDLYEDLVVAPKSSIALQNLTIVQGEGEIAIDSQNDTIDFKIYAPDNQLKTATLTHGVYKDSSLAALFDDINRAMNVELVDPVNKPLRGKYNGSEWNINQTLEKRVQVQYRKARYYTPNFNIEPDCVGQYVEYGGVNQSYFPNGGTDGTDDSYFFSRTPFVMGSGSIIATLADLVGSSVSYEWGNGKGSALNWNKLGETKNHPR